MSGWLKRLLSSVVTAVPAAPQQEGEQAQAEPTTPDTASSGLPLIKEWNSTKDDQVCPICKAMDGKKVRMDQPFTVDGHKMMQPWDESLGAPPHPHGDCRCFVAYELDRQRPDDN